MKVGAPQIIYTALLLISTGVSLARYGQPKNDSYDSIDCFVGPALVLSLLWWGGFYG